MLTIKFLQIYFSDNLTSAEKVLKNFNVPNLIKMRISVMTWDIYVHPAETLKNSDNCDLLKVFDIGIALYSMEI